MKKQIGIYLTLIVIALTFAACAHRKREITEAEYQFIEHKRQLEDWQWLRANCPKKDRGRCVTR